MKRKAQGTLAVVDAKKTKYQEASHNGDKQKKTGKKRKDKHKPNIELSGVKKLSSDVSPGQFKKKMNIKRKEMKLFKQSKHMALTPLDKSSSTKCKSLLKNHKKCKLGITKSTPVSNKVDTKSSVVQKMKKKQSRTQNVNHSSENSYISEKKAKIKKFKGKNSMKKQKSSNLKRTKHDCSKKSITRSPECGSKNKTKFRKEMGDLKDRPVEKVAEADNFLLRRSPEEYSSNWKKFLASMKKQSSGGVSREMKEEKSKKVTKRKPQQKQTKTDHPEIPDVWFDDVDEVLIETFKPKDATDDPLVKSFSYKGVTKIVAMDCEMVGVGQRGEEDMLARVSVVNQHGRCLYDKFVKPMEDVIDYRTKVSGVRPEHLVSGEDFTVVQKDVADMLKGRILVGHAIHNDLKVLYLDHPKKMIRDTSRYKPFRRLFGGRIPSLKKLSAQVLKVQVQQGEHDSVQDSQAAMRLYTMYRKQWEKEIKTKKHRFPKAKGRKK